MSARVLKAGGHALAVTDERSADRPHALRRLWPIYRPKGSAQRGVSLPLRVAILRPAAAAACFVVAMALLGGGFGLAFLTPSPGPREAALGFALMGGAGVLMVCAGALMGFGRGE